MINPLVAPYCPQNKTQIIWPLSTSPTHTRSGLYIFLLLPQAWSLGVPHSSTTLTSLVSVKTIALDFCLYLNFPVKSPCPLPTACHAQERGKGQLELMPKSVHSDYAPCTVRALYSIPQFLITTISPQGTDQ